MNYTARTLVGWLAAGPRSLLGPDDLTGTAFWYGREEHLFQFHLRDCTMRSMTLYRASDYSGQVVLRAYEGSFEGPGSQRQRKITGHRLAYGLLTEEARVAALRALECVAQAALAPAQTALQMKSLSPPQHDPAASRVAMAVYHCEVHALGGLQRLSWWGSLDGLPHDRAWQQAWETCERVLADSPALNDLIERYETKPRVKHCDFSQSDIESMVEET